MGLSPTVNHTKNTVTVTPPPRHLMCLLQVTRGKTKKKEEGRRRGEVT
jgi:hypothetical protein